MNWKAKPAKLESPAFRSKVWPNKERLKLAAGDIYGSVSVPYLIVFSSRGPALDGFLLLYKCNPECREPLVHKLKFRSQLTDGQFMEVPPETRHTRILALTLNPQP